LLLLASIKLKLGIELMSKGFVISLVKLSKRRNGKGGCPWWHFFILTFFQKNCENNLWPKVFSKPSPFCGATSHGTAAQLCGAIVGGAAEPASVAPSPPRSQRGKGRAHATVP
jgi:hypothetical protein